MRRSFILASLAATLTLGATAAGAQSAATPEGGSVELLSIADAGARDAREMSVRLAIPLEEAERRFRLQEASVAATDRIADHYAGRIAGISLEHAPRFRIVVLLKGDAPVADEVLGLNGDRVDVRFVTGAAASHVELVQAISAFQAAIRASLLVAPALGVDQRTGELVAVVSGRDVAREGAEPLRARLAALTHVPIRLRVVDEPARDLAGIEGGARMVGAVPGDPRRYLCTAGFVVTDGARTALSTAAHCPDTLHVRDAGGREAVLPFVGQWGWGNQDLQINLSDAILAPTFFSDTPRTQSRPVTGSRSRAGTRAGDVVCHRGERTGYSCATVELTDFAPAGDLCGGACLPTWTTVSGPGCRSGDSGGPVFAGTVAFGILKGGSYRSDGTCAFYFYMSIDYLPPPWRLLTTPASGSGPAGGGSSISVGSDRQTEVMR